MNQRSLMKLKVDHCLKNTSPSKPKSSRVDEIRPEYRFDYAKAKPNRFAKRTRPGADARSPAAR
jgi:hypothetical protein